MADIALRLDLISARRILKEQEEQIERLRTLLKLTLDYIPSLRTDTSRRLPQLRLRDAISLRERIEKELRQSNDETI